MWSASKKTFLSPICSSFHALHGFINSLPEKYSSSFFFVLTTIHSNNKITVAQKYYFQNARKYLIIQSEAIIISVSDLTDFRNSVFHISKPHIHEKFFANNNLFSIHRPFRA